MASRVEISKRLLLINSASSIGAHILHFSVLVWLHQYLLRRVSPDEYSLYPLVLAIIGFVPLFTVVLTSGLGRYVVEAYAQGDENRVRQIVSSMVPLLLITSLVLLFVGGLIAWYVDWFLVVPEGLVGDARLMILMAIFSLAIQLPCGPMQLGWYVRQKFVVINILKTCAEITRSAVLLTLLLLVSTRVLWVVVAMVVGEIFSLVATLIVSLRAVPALRYRCERIHWDLVRAITGFGGWNFLLALAGRTREYAVPLILNHMGTPTDIATFQIGTMGRRQVDQWFEVASRPIPPIIMGMHAMGAKERFQNAYLRGGRIGLWVKMAVAIPAMIYSERLIRVYLGNKYEDYADAATVLAITLACYVLSAGSWMTWIMAAAKAQMRPLGIRVSSAELAGVVLTVITTGWLGLGAVGAAIATFLASSFSAVVFLLPIGLRFTEVSLQCWIRRTLVPGLAPGSVAAAVWVSLNLLAKPDSWFDLGWCVLTGGLCYIVVLLAFCTEPQDRADLFEIMRRVRNRLVGPSRSSQPPSATASPAEQASPANQGL